MIELDIVLPRQNFDLAIKESFGAGITGIFGPSGAGKTSLLHVIAGLARPKAGKITINGRVLFDSEEKINRPVEKRNIGYVFQEGRLFPHMSVAQNLQYGIKKNQPSLVSLDEVVDLLNLGHIYSSKPARISGGERQRTALGRSLLSSPEVLLLDEPFSAVDMQLRQQILPFLIRIQQKVQVPTLVVSHDLPDLLKLSQQLCLIGTGKVLGHGPYYELLKDASASAMFGSSNLINSASLQVQVLKPEAGLAILESPNPRVNLKIYCELHPQLSKKGQPVKIFLRARDIALSQQKVEGLSMQNQIQGKVQDIIQRDSSRVCVLDMGFPLVVEISPASQDRLGIHIGSTLWCLFKSSAIELAM